jgi:hypothetical protein
MCHKSFIREQILRITRETSQERRSWHSEAELEDFFVAQGYDLDLVQDVVDELISDDQLNLDEDRVSGGYLVRGSRQQTA